MRLDIFIHSKYALKSRQYAQNLIKSGNVAVNGVFVTKSGFEINGGETVEINDESRYVGRGGLKLEHALSRFSVSVEGKTALDIGASTGGFTDCLLRFGVKKVYAVDVGHGQLAETLREDFRVVNMERTHVKDLTLDTVGFSDIITVDVSFISLRKVIPHLKKLMKSETVLICLFKPQFEIGKKVKNGVIKNESIRESLLDEFKVFAEAEGFFIKGTEPSPILGGDGNKEFLLYLVKRGD